MTLTVTLEEFPAAVHRVLKGKDAYVSQRGSTCVVTAVAEGKLVVASAKVSMAAATEQLEKAGMVVHAGTWHLGSDPVTEEADSFYVAAVSYASSDEKPGLWMDAYPDPPTGVQVLRSMYDEFISTGELHETSFEEFLRLANANVVILSPADLRSFAHAKDC